MSKRIRVLTVVMLGLMLGAFAGLTTEARAGGEEGWRYCSEVGSDGKCYTCLAQTCGAGQDCCRSQDVE